LLLPGGGAALKRPVHAEDAVQGLAGLLNKPDAFGKVLALAGGESLTLLQMIHRIAEGLGKKPKYLTVPRIGCQIGVRVGEVLLPKNTWLRQSMLGWIFNASPSISEMQALINYNPRPFTPKNLVTNSTFKPDE